VATEQGLQASSFDQAAGSYERAVGCRISGDTVRRITEGFGERVAQWRQAAMEAVYDLLQGDESAVAVRDPIEDQANISTDGTMILIRGEGWKEVKLTIVSRVEVTASEKGKAVTLGDHSCQAGLWDADTMAQYQYLEGLRRGLLGCQRLSSVNDAAAWIARITQDNFPEAVMVVDWPHAEGRVWSVANSLFGKGTESARQWAEAQSDALWQGQGEQIVAALQRFSQDEARRAQGYFSEHLQQMAYSCFRREGYPIGSGTVESGGKNYVQRRMKRSGPGWNRDTGQAMLSALSELHSGRFELAWEHCA
jgi:hypothetical protein